MSSVYRELGRFRSWFGKTWGTTQPICLWRKLLHLGRPKWDDTGPTTDIYTEVLFLFRTKKVTSDVGSLIWGIFFRITCQIVTTLRIQDYPEISWWWEGFGSWDILRYSEVGGWMTRLNHLSFHQTWGERGHWSDSNQNSCSMAAVAQGHVPNGKFWPLDPWAIYWNLSFPRKNGWLEDNYRFFFCLGSSWLLMLPGSPGTDGFSTCFKVGKALNIWLALQKSEIVGETYTYILMAYGASDWNRPGWFVRNSTLWVWT